MSAARHRFNRASDVDCSRTFLYGDLMYRVRGVLLVALLCASCGWLGVRKRPSVPSDKLWSEGNQAMQDEAWDLAIQDYKRLLEQYPFDPNAEEAELNIAEAYFNEGRYPEAIAAFGDFERMHPTSENLAQIEYRRGMAYLAQHRSADRDQQAIKNALDSFRNIVDRYPGTPWATRAELRVRECREELAEHDAGIAKFYLQRGSLRAAESRLRGLLTSYPDTQATAQALDRFAKVYAARDEPEEANLALATLARYHGDSQLGREARDQLKSLDPSEGQDPLPMLVARIDAMRTQADREKVPTPVSAYSDRPGMPSGRGY
jgi:outer membrane protein assembly factor BamD